MDNNDRNPIQGRFGSASSELRELVRAVCDETLTPAQRDRLEELLRDDEDARLFYLAHLDMAARLQFSHRGSMETGEGSMPIGAAPKRSAILPAPGGRSRWLAPRMLVTALLLFVIIGGTVLLSWRHLRQGNEPSGPMVTAAGSPWVATLGRAVGVVWEGAAPDMANPVFARGSELRMKQGLAELSFSSGVLMVVEGPAVLQFESHDSVVLASGKLRAEVPNEAIGFVVRTPRAKIVDLGTAFGAAVDPSGRTEVQVFRGKVDAEVQDPSGQPARYFQVSEGEALNIGDTRDAIVTLTTNPNAFPKLPPLSPAELWNRWQAHRQRLLRDPDLAGYWSFDHKDARDLSAHHNDGFPMNSPAYSADVPAVLGGGMCLDVSAGPKFVQVPPSRSLDFADSGTIAFWLRGTNQQQDWARVISKAGMMNCSGWVIHRGGDLNQIRTVVGTSGHCNQSVANVSGVYDNKWHHLAIVLNDGSWQVYVDGEFNSHGTYHHYDGIRSTAELVIGAAGQDQMMFGSLDFEGQIDELCMFRRPLSSDEIRRICPVGELKMQDTASQQRKLAANPR